MNKQENKNVVIIDNGGTKSDWALWHNSSYHIYTTAPLQPNSKLSSRQIELLSASEGNDIMIYSAGAYDTIKKEKLSILLNQYLNHEETTLSIHSDLLGAARATIQDERGIVCILGTGSNASYYENGELISLKPSLGYIMDDEGSGTSIGKSIIKAFLYNELPPLEHNFIQDNYGITKRIVLRNIEDPKSARAYISQFAKIPNEMSSAVLNAIVRSCLREFIERRILSYDEYLSYPIHFVGSIAYFYRTLINELCSEYNLTLGKIVQKPIHGLIKYHNE